MSQSSSLTQSQTPVATSKLRDFIVLTKPRISVMVLFTVAAAGYAASPYQDWYSWGILHAVVGTFLVAASGSALNQYLERWFDGRMKRTAKRPLPTRRLSSMEVVVFGTITISSGLVYLWLTVGITAFLIALTTWVMYVWIYTPLKRVTWWNTLIGAIAGALPIMIGWSATGAPFNALAWSMFGVLFLWQFPHFMAIAWLYREEYARGFMKMLPVIDSTGLSAGIHAVVCALLLIPTSLVPFWVVPECPVWFAVLCFVVNAVYLAYSIYFMAQRNDRTARYLLRSSLLYLPLFYGALMFVV